MSRTYTFVEFAYSKTNLEALSDMGVNRTAKLWSCPTLQAPSTLKCYCWLLQYDLPREKCHRDKDAYSVLHYSINEVKSHYTAMHQNRFQEDSQSTPNEARTNLLKWQFSLHQHCRAMHSVPAGKTLTKMIPRSSLSLPGKPKVIDMIVSHKKENSKVPQLLSFIFLKNLVLSAGLETMHKDKFSLAAFPPLSAEWVWRQLPTLHPDPPNLFRSRQNCTCHARVFQPTMFSKLSLMELTGKNDIEPSQEASIIHFLRFSFSKQETILYLSHCLVEVQEGTRKLLHKPEAFHKNLLSSKITLEGTIAIKVLRAIAINIRNYVLRKLKHKHASYSSN